MAFSRTILLSSSTLDVQTLFLLLICWPGRIPDTFGGEKWLAHKDMKNARLVFQQGSMHSWEQRLSRRLGLNLNQGVLSRDHKTRLCRRRVSAGQPPIAGLFCFMLAGCAMMLAA